MKEQVGNSNLKEQLAWLEKEGYKHCLRNVKDVLQGQGHGLFNTL